jgi:hypothetical protein
MTSRNILKQWFSHAKKPTAGQFAEWIDSFWHKTEDIIQVSDVQNLSNILAGKASMSDLDTKADITYVDAQDQTEATLRQGGDDYLQTQVDNKVDVVAGYGLSQENYTASEKTKLANLSEHFKGNYTSAVLLTAGNPSGVSGDYAYVDAGVGADAKMYIWDTNDNVWVLSSGGGVVPDATESNAGIVALATITQALARTDDARAMTALKTIGLLLDELKNVDRQIAPIGVNEVSFLMKKTGNVTALTISGATNAKLKIGTAGTYPVGAQTFPFAYVAGDRVFVTFNYSDLNNASCNIILTCRDN